VWLLQRRQSVGTEEIKVQRNNLWKKAFKSSITKAKSAS